MMFEDKEKQESLELEELTPAEPPVEEGYLSLSDLSITKEEPKLATEGASSSIASYQKKSNAFVDWLRKHIPFLFNRDSLFYFGAFVILVALFWCGYSLLFNHFTQFYGWDYTSQYVTFYYGYWDSWHSFFRTGIFRLYDYQTFLGTDAIGSNSYYGLFDPFVVAMAFFPRSWIPQMTVIMTFAKIAFAAFTMRAYLKYMGISEWTSRFGALAFAFSGYMNFMVGFPTTVAACTWLPMILLGIEKVVHERKPTYLIFGLFLEGVTSFFFLVVFCIFGVIYAMWRYFCTIKSRNAKENWSTIGMGVAAFAIGLMLCAFTLFPSLRESSLSGRTDSIGRLYLNALLDSLKSFDLGRFFSLLFQQVGENPGREEMALISFFYPTSGYLFLPLSVSRASYRYDAWTASIFCYTPFVILFFVGILNSLRRKKWSHLVAIVLCLFLLFTTFAYYFFYAFTGNGYGRWFIVLVPIIIYYGCWAFDDRKNAPKWFFLAGSVIALVMTALTYLITVWTLKGKTFSATNVTGDGYYVEEYYTAGETNLVSQMPVKLIWYVYYQLALVLVEGLILVFLNRKKWVSKVLCGFIGVEAVVMGNMSFVYGSSWPLENFNGGPTRFATTVGIANNINTDNSFFRTYWDEVAGGTASSGEKNFANAVGTNGASTFHSLMNFNVYDYAVMTRISGAGGGGTAYGEAYYNPSWSGFYNNKRFATDYKLGMKYYVIEKGGYGQYEQVNVPFGAREIPEYETSQYRVFVNDAVPTLGHAVENNKLYRLGRVSNYENFFYVGGATYRPLWTEQKLIDGAIFDDEAVLPDGYVTAQPTDRDNISTQNRTKYYFSNLDVYKYTTSGNNRYLPDSSKSYANLGPGYLLSDDADVLADIKKTKLNNSSSYAGDFDHIVFTPKVGGYFNSDPSSTGAYFDMYTPGATATRFYFIGDEVDDAGNITATNKVLSYEYRCYDVIKNMDSYAAFGMYAKGKVKAIVLCGMSGRTCSMPSWSSYAFYMQDRSYIEDRVSYMNDNALKDVVKVNDNKFTFSTSYSEAKWVVTTLGFDEGWHVYAGGKELTTCRLDGGFVGFLAPAGATDYRMEYVTPYLKTGVGLFVAGFGIYCTYMIYTFVKDYRNIKSSTSLVANRGKKKEDDDSSSNTEISI